MINGGSTEFPINGWHGAYVVSGFDNKGMLWGTLDIDYPSKSTSNRIYPIDAEMSVFVKHSQQAFEMWMKKRHLFTTEWIAK